MSTRGRSTQSQNRTARADPEENPEESEGEEEEPSRGVAIPLADIKLRQVPPPLAETARYKSRFMIDDHPYEPYTLPTYDEKDQPVLDKSGQPVLRVVQPDQLKPPMFKNLVDTLKNDMKNVYDVAVMVYGYGDFGKWKRKLSKKYLTQLMKKMDILNKYYKIKSGARKRKSKLLVPGEEEEEGQAGGGQLKGTFFVFQNIHDWIQNTNMGNGFVSKLTHIDIKETVAKKPKKVHVPNPKTFINYANRRLPADRKTDLAELLNLIYMHNPGDKQKYVSGRDVAAAEFRTDGKGNVDPSPQANPRLDRMVEIQNAYADYFNGTRRQGEDQIPVYSLQEAAAMATPQKARIEFIAPESDAKNAPKRAYGFDTNEVFNAPVTLSDGQQYVSSAVSSGMCTVILALMANANKLQDAKLSGFLHYDIFEKYFHEDYKKQGQPGYYEPGTNVGFYLDGQYQSLGLNLSAAYKDADPVTAVADVVGRAFQHVNSNSKSKSTDSSLTKLTNQLIEANSANPRTPFEYINKQESEEKRQKRLEKARREGKPAPPRSDEDKSFIPKDNKVDGYGIKGYAATQMAYLFKIPMDALAPESQADLGEFKDRRPNEPLAITDLHRKADATRMFLTSVNDVYTSYTKFDKQERDKAAKASAAKTPKADLRRAAASTVTPRSASRGVSPSSGRGRGGVSPTPRARGGVSPGPRAAPSPNATGARTRSTAPVERTGGISRGGGRSEFREVRETPADKAVARGEALAAAGQVSPTAQRTTSTAQRTPSTGQRTPSSGRTVAREPAPATVARGGPEARSPRGVRGRVTGTTTES
jgi:hypothetical protein